MQQKNSLQLYYRIAFEESQFIQPERELRSDPGRAVQVYRWENSFLKKGSDVSKLTHILHGRAGARLHISFCSLLWLPLHLMSSRACPWSEGFPFSTLTMHLAPQDRWSPGSFALEAWDLYYFPDPFLTWYSFLASSSTCLFLTSAPFVFFFFLCLALPCPVD